MVTARQVAHTPPYMQDVDDDGDDDDVDVDDDDDDDDAVSFGTVSQAAKNKANNIITKYLV